jgi:hypothetical protein
MKRLRRFARRRDSRCYLRREALPVLSKNTDGSPPVLACGPRYRRAGWPTVTASGFYSTLPDLLTGNKASDLNEFPSGDCCTLHRRCELLTKIQ